MQKIKQIINFLTEDIWRIRSIELPKKKKFLIKQGRVIMLTLRGFSKDKCVLRASSLTFFTLLSIVPIFAMGFGIAKGFNLQKILEERLRSAFEGMKGHEDILKNILDFSQNQLENTGGGVIAGLGVFLLFWTIVKLLGNIEWAFNDIWGIKNNRNLPRKISDYLIVVIVAPLFLIIAGGATAFISSQPEKLMQNFEILKNFSDLIILSMKFLPLIILVPLFTFLYIFMPNTKVKIKSGLVSGIFAAICFMLLQTLYVYFQVKIFTKYSAIYGSFAAIPMFLIWLEFSWMIVLFGSELSFAVQNVETCEFEADSENATQSFKQIMAVCITSLIVEKFEEGAPPPTTKEIRDELEIPSRLAHLILHDLTEAGIIIRVIFKKDERVDSYQPAMPDQKLTIQLILDKLGSIGSDKIPYKETDRVKKISQAIAELKEGSKNSKANIRLHKI